MTGRLVGKSALITGSARGIGKHFAQRYLAEGATVAIADINLNAAEQTAKELGAGAYAVHMDVTDVASINAAIASVVDHAVYTQATTAYIVTSPDVNIETAVIAVATSSRWRGRSQFSGVNTSSITHRLIFYR